jgi:IMP dehydrogenase/GMP reductase
VSVKTKLSRNITLNNPLVSSNMDTVRRTSPHPPHVAPRWADS